jgi:hypothetical protein
VKRVIIVVLVVALVVLMIAPVAFAGGHSKAYGKNIKAECGASYGQLVSATRTGAAHPIGAPSGAKGFYTGPLFGAHCGGG